MPFVELSRSPLAGGPARIHYRDRGAGPVLVFLHGGWGYEMYPLEEPAGLRILIPDRTGYGLSSKPARFSPSFHHDAAVETLALLDALGIARAALWGHSDGAVIAARIGLAAPERCTALVLEAFHYYSSKPGSRDFFQAAALHAGFFGGRLGETLAREHGEPYWRELVRAHAQAWLNIAVVPGDLYGGKLGGLSPPALFLHGSQDPRTEPGELEAVRRALPAARFHVVEGGGHSPHSEPGSAAECLRAVREFLHAAR